MLPALFILGLFAGFCVCLAIASLPNIWLKASPTPVRHLCGVSFFLAIATTFVVPVDLPDAVFSFLTVFPLLAFAWSMGLLAVYFIYRRVVKTQS